MLPSNLFRTDMHVTRKFLIFTNRIMLMYPFVPSIFFSILFPLGTVKKKKQTYIYIYLHWGRNFSTPPLLGPGYLGPSHSFQTSPQGVALAANALTPTPTAQCNWDVSEPDPGCINHSQEDRACF